MLWLPAINDFAWRPGTIVATQFASEGDGGNAKLGVRLKGEEDSRQVRYAQLTEIVSASQLNHETAPNDDRSKGLLCCLGDCEAVRCEHLISSSWH